MTNHQTINITMGRIFGMMMRAEQPGDVAEYERCRSLIIDLVDAPADYSIGFARDYGKGAQGQWG